MVDALTGVEGTDDLGVFLASEELSAPTLLDFEVVSAQRTWSWPKRSTAHC